jgi:hypothetical protein
MVEGYARNFCRANAAGIDDVVGAIDDATVGDPLAVLWR